jgi:hypothetical protein
MVGGLFARGSRVHKTRDKSRPWAFQLWEMPILRLRADDVIATRRKSTFSNSFYPQTPSDEVEKLSLGDGLTQPKSTGASHQTSENEPTLPSSHLGRKTRRKNVELRLATVPENSVAKDIFPFLRQESKDLPSNSSPPSYFTRFSSAAAASVTAAGHRNF